MDPSDVVARFAEVPINRHLGYRLVRADAAGAAIAMSPRACYAQERGVVQGGILTALADTAAAYALVPTLVEGESMAGVELKMNFLRSATVDGAELEASSRARKRGRQLSVCEVEVRQGDRVVATGTFTFLHVWDDRHP